MTPQSTFKRMCFVSCFKYKRRSCYNPYRTIQSMPIKGLRIIIYKEAPERKHLKNCRF